MENLAWSVITNKCPYCNTGKVFKKRVSLFKIPEMNAECSSCQRKFDGEPGYFVGAMYISYAISIATGILLYVVCNSIAEIESINIIIGIIGTVLLLISFQNYKWSRIIWLKVFPPDN